MVSIHQPRHDIFRLFDRVVLLAKAPGADDGYDGEVGKIVYCGPPLEAAPQLRAAVSSVAQRRDLAPNLNQDHADNPADEILDLCSSPDVSALVQAFDRGDGGDGGGEGGATPRQDASDRKRITHDIDRLTEAADTRESSHGRGASLASILRGRNRVMFHTELWVLCQRLLSKAVRHPMLLALHYGGSIFMAVTLGSIFADLQYDLNGAQDRIGVLFFMLFYLALLSMSSLPVWRDEYLLFAHERASNIYGNLSYFLSVVLMDVLLVRVVPPCAFALISYDWMSLQGTCESCLYRFAAILVVSNVLFALYAMGIGALRLSTMIANIVGAVSVMVFVLMGGFMVDKDQMSGVLAVLIAIDPMSYAFEALMINEFHDAVTASGDPVYYLINATFCAKALPPISVEGDTILSTFNYASTNAAINKDFRALVYMAFILLALVYAVLVLGPVVASTCGQLSSWVCHAAARPFRTWSAANYGGGAEGTLDRASPKLLADNGTSDGLNEGPDAGAVLSWHNICLWVPSSGCGVGPLTCRGERQVLHSVSGLAGSVEPDVSRGAVVPGDLCGIMGPSGSGKVGCRGYQIKRASFFFFLVTHN